MQPEVSAELSLHSLSDAEPGTYHLAAEAILDRVLSLQVDLPDAALAFQLLGEPIPHRQHLLAIPAPGHIEQYEPTLASAAAAAAIGSNQSAKSPIGHCLGRQHGARVVVGSRIACKRRIQQRCQSKRQ